MADQRDRMEKERVRQEQEDLLASTRQLVPPICFHADEVEISPETLEHLEKSCQEARTELSKLDGEIAKRKSRVFNSNKKDLRHITLLEEHKLYKGNTKSVEGAQPFPLPEDEKIHQMLAIEHLEKETEQLTDTLAWATSQRDNLKGKIARENEQLAEREEINERLERELSQLHLANAQERTEEVILADIKKKDDAAIKYFNKLRIYFGAFVEEHFPPPDPEEVRDWRRQNGIRSEGELLPMLDILGEALNRVLDAPHDPYVHVSSDYWPPYIQMLVRVGVLQRHPEDDSRVKMTPYHL